MSLARRKPDSFAAEPGISHPEMSWLRAERFVAVPGQQAARAAMEIVPAGWRLSADPASEIARIGTASRRQLPCDVDPAACCGACGERVVAVKKPARSLGRVLALILSTSLHVGIAVAAMAMLPAVAPLLELERGGMPSAIDVLLVGPEDSLETKEGAKPVEETPVEPKVEEVSITVPEAPPVPEVRIELPEVAVPRPPDVGAISLPAELMIPVPDGEIPPLPDSLKPPETLAPPPVAKVEPPKEVPPKVEPPKVQPPNKVEPPKREAKKAPKKTEPKKAEHKKAEPKKKEIVRRETAPPTARGTAGSGASASTTRASARGGTGGAGSSAGTAAMASYRGRFVAHLARYKTYPEQANDRGITGRTAVRITIDRSGRVLSSSIASGSGHAILDSATLAAVRRAQPFPAIPPDGPATFTHTVGLNYNLRN
jgi:protein TonB